MTLTFNPPQAIIMIHTCALNQNQRSAGSKDTHTRPFNGPFSGTTQVSRYQKSKTNLDFTEARDSEWQWNHLGHMQVCTSLQTDNHASTPPLSFLQAGCSSCRPTNSVKALKATGSKDIDRKYTDGLTNAVTAVTSNPWFFQRYQAKFPVARMESVTTDLTSRMRNGRKHTKTI